VTNYNQLGQDELRDRLQPESDEQWDAVPKQLPFIVIVADEMADLMMTAGKDVEQHIIRLAQKSRAVGIHLILATQKPTVDVITGLIKSNLPARIAFQVSSRTDSRVVLDEMGADKLLGNGDLLFLQPGTSVLHRGQGTYVTDDEINRVVNAVATNEPQFVKELVQLKTKEEQEAGPGAALKSRDELYEAAIDVVVREGRGSVSLLQRTLGIGYGRAARLIDFMAEDGIVGAYNGSQAREVVISTSEWEAMYGQGESAQPTIPALDAPKRPARTNRIQPEPEEEEVEAGGYWDGEDDEAAESDPEEYDADEEAYDEEESDGEDEYENEDEDDQADDHDYEEEDEEGADEDDEVDEDEEYEYDEEEDELDESDEEEVDSDEESDDDEEGEEAGDPTHDIILRRRRNHLRIRPA
jgi:S-DNA-T family DNA segregation ATPase FtsK/SpoIIIE